MLLTLEDNGRYALHMYNIFLTFLLWSLCQSELTSSQRQQQQNVTCPFSSDCQCSSTQCIGPIQVWCTAQGHFPIFTKSSNCEVDLLRIDGEYSEIPEKALVAFTDRIRKLQLVPRSTLPLQIDAQAFQGSIGLFLEQFELYDQRTVVGFPPALKAFKKLHTLLLNNTAITEIPAQTLSDKILETLRVSDAQIRDIDRDAFLALPFLFNLQLPTNNLTRFPRDALLPVMQSLRALDLSNNRIGALDEGALKGFDRLRSLNLSGNPLNRVDDGSLTIGDDPSSTITHLDLSKCELDAFPKAALRNLKTLKRLDLSENRITTIPANAFRGLTEVTEVNLNKNPIRTIEAGAFATAALSAFTLYASDLEELDLAAFDGNGGALSVVLFSSNAKLSKIHCSSATADAPRTPIEIHLYGNNVTTIDRSVGAWLTAGAKIVTDGNYHFDCNLTNIRWLAGAYKCFDTAPLVITNTWCASDNESEPSPANRTSLTSLLNDTFVDCRQFFEKSQTRTTQRPSPKGNSALSTKSSLVVLATLLLLIETLVISKGGAF